MKDAVKLILSYLVKHYKAEMITRLFFHSPTGMPLIINHI